MALISPLDYCDRRGEQAKSSPSSPKSAFRRGKMARSVPCDQSRRDPGPTKPSPAPTHHQSAGAMLRPAGPSMTHTIRPHRPPHLANSASRPVLRPGFPRTFPGPHPPPKPRQSPAWALARELETQGTFYFSTCWTHDGTAVLPVRARWHSRPTCASPVAQPSRLCAATPQRRRPTAGTTLRVVRPQPLPQQPPPSPDASAPF